LLIHSSGVRFKVMHGVEYDIDFCRPILGVCHALLLQRINRHPLLRPRFVKGFFGAASRLGHQIGQPRHAPSVGP
jgi:hypothetical protein